jgi:alpha-beta hydrolase superfamily lysophospholipase
MNRSRAIPLTTLLALACATLGCRSVQPASFAPVPRADTSDARPETTGTPAPQTTSTDRWPPRWGDDPDTRGVIVEVTHPLADLGAAHLSRHHTLRVSDTEYDDADALARAIGFDGSYKFRAEGPGSFLFAQRDPSQTPRDVEEPDLLFKFVSAAPNTSKKADADEEHILIQRTWFTYRTPLTDAPPVATLVLLPGMFGTPEPIVDATERYFRTRGYAVLRMLAHPSRFTEHAAYVIGSEYEGKNADEIAAMYDSRTAECAYAAHAALAHVNRHHPENASNPVLLLGMSGGAMVLPTVYAYAPDRFDACVLIAGGGNFFEISATSNYAKWIDAIEFLTVDEEEMEVVGPSADLIRKVSNAYLESSRLDALKTAPEMRDVPVLMLHASSDRAVPAKTGDALHRALGEPERWVYPMGHELIFATLPMQIPKIESWAREHMLETGDAQADD